jgi:peptidoglycan endopeptidase LytE
VVVKSYTVVSGDTLSKIAAKFGVTVTALKAANNLTSDIIKLGQKLLIP